MLWRGSARTALLLLCQLLVFMGILRGASSAAEACIEEHAVYVNYVVARCSNPGAIPAGAGDTLMRYDFREVPQEGDLVSLVASYGAGSYADCAHLPTNPQNTTGVDYASGWLRPEAQSDTTVATVQRGDLAAALARMAPAEVLEVCWFRNATGAWRNSGIRLALQDAAVGLRVNGVANARGVRAGVPKVDFVRNWTAEVLRGRAAPPGEGDAFALAEPERSCAGFTPPPPSYEVDTPRPTPRTNRTRRVPHPVLIGHAFAGSQSC
jgi:hypothetical protein